MGGIGGGAAAGTDRDFGCLVWDVEAQSGGGASAVGGGGLNVKVKGKREADWSLQELNHLQMFLCFYFSAHNFYFSLRCYVTCWY